MTRIALVTVYMWILAVVAVSVGMTAFALYNLLTAVRYY